MWIIAKHGFVSLVQSRDNPGFIRARARRREHLVDTFPGISDDDVIDLGEDAPDYRWHANVDRTVAAQMMYDTVMNDLDYDSHVKEEVSGTDNEMYSAMLSCWTALRRLQDPVADGDWWHPRTAAYDRWEENPDGWRPSYTVDGGGVFRDRELRALESNGRNRTPGQEKRYQQLTKQVTSHEESLSTLSEGLADRMLNRGNKPKVNPLTRLSAQFPFEREHEDDEHDDPLPSKVWRGKKGRCVVCEDPISSGEEYVDFPEDDMVGLPSGPAHVVCAQDEGYTVS